MDNWNMGILMVYHVENEVHIKLCVCVCVCVCVRA